MNETDPQLAAAWRADLPPARDAMFRIALLVRMERRRFAGRMAVVLSLGAVITALTLAALPRLGAVVASASPEATLMLIAGLLLAATGWGLLRAFRVA